MVPQIRNQLGMFELVGVLESVIETTEGRPELGFQLLFVRLATCTGMLAGFLPSHLDIKVLDLGLPLRAYFRDLLLIEKIFLME